MTVRVAQNPPLPSSVDKVASVTAGGSLGVAQSLAMVANNPQWLTGTLSANLVVTVTAFPAGSRATLKLTQGASTAYTVAVSDGSNVVPVSVPKTLGTFFEIGLSSADGATIDVSLNGVPGATGPAGGVGLQGNTGLTGPTGPNNPYPNPPSAGEETVDRFMVASTGTMTSGVMRVVYFTARVSETITKLLLTTATTAAGATPTLVRAGVYSVDASDNLVAILASFANDTSVYATASTEYLKTLSASFNKVAGTRYAVGILVVTAATAPTIPACVLGSTTISGNSNNRRRICTSISAQSDLPASFTVTSGLVTNVAPYVELVP